jgi:hypothetical protein
MQIIVTWEISHTGFVSQDSFIPRPVCGLEMFDPIRAWLIFKASAFRNPFGGCALKSDAAGQAFFLGQLLEY